MTAINKVKSINYHTVYIGVNQLDPYGPIYEKHGCIKIVDTVFKDQPTTIYRYFLKSYYNYLTILRNQMLVLRLVFYSTYIDIICHLFLN